MRCPKCHYLSFEPEPRCKNCGYDLSFEPVDLEIGQPERRQEALADLDLHIKEVPAPPAAPQPTTETINLGTIPPTAEIEIHPHVELEAIELTSSPAPEPVPGPVARIEPRMVKAAAPARSERPKLVVPTAVAPVATPELPLFVKGLTEPDRFDPPATLGPVPAPPFLESPVEPEHDEPLVKFPRAPRPPLSVRRPTPAAGRVREKYQRERSAAQQAGLLERDLLETADERPSPFRLLDDPPPPALEAAPPASAARVSAVRRIEAAVVDALFIGSINLAVIWLTLQRLDLGLVDVLSLPILPLAAFLFLVDTGYLLMFTVTNGQTIGKMAAGIRVIGSADPALADGRVTLKQAMLRALLTFPSVLALGIGFLPGLIGQGLALHDRFAHTRVVRA